ncbi:MAG: TOBE domain-containing protein [Caulobacterales bacterium]
MQSQTAARALLQLRKGGQSRVGAERIRLLEVIGEQGSISAAAKALGLSYKGAWDAVQALNNLFERPLVAAHTGGRTGGAAIVTPAGQAVILAFRKVEGELTQVVEKLEQYLSDGSPLEQVIRSLSMKTSARNALRGVVTSVKAGQVNSEVTLRVSDGVEIVAIVTRESVADLELVPGREAMALIKSSFVILAPGGAPVRTSARNCLSGVVSRHEAGAVNDEVVLDLGQGKTITATITHGSGETLGLKVGETAQALIKASHVILAVD